MSDPEIKNMDFKQLRNEVQLLRDTIAIMQRKYEDLLYNLDDENLSGRMLKEKEDMKAEIKITVEEISTKVSKDDFETAITQTAEQIETTALKSISAKFVSSERPTNANTSDTEKRMLCEYDGNLYYYNLNTKTWKVYPTDGVRSQFIQTGDGFKLDGAVVEISGDLIAGGTIKGSTLAGGVLKNAEETHRLEMTATDRYGSFKLYNQYNDSIPYFSLYDTTLGGVGLWSYGIAFLGAHAAGGEVDVTPYGNWDFSECEHLKLPDSIDCIAKFA